MCVQREGLMARGSPQPSQQLPSNCCCGPHAPWPYKIERYAGNNLDRHYVSKHSSIRGLHGQQRGLDIGALCPLRTQRLVLLQHPAHVYTVALRSETEKGFWRKDRQINPQPCKSQACFQGSSIRSGHGFATHRARPLSSVALSFASSRATSPLIRTVSLIAVIPSEASVRARSRSARRPSHSAVSSWR